MVLYQLSPPADEPRQTPGIGLSFCRAAAKALGGRIWVEYRKGGGSRFILEIPA